MATKIKTSALTPELRQYMSATKKKNEQTSHALGNELMEFLNKRKENGTLLSGVLSDEERQSYIDKTSAVKTERFKQSERAEADRQAVQQAKRQAAMTAPGVVDSVGEAEKATLGDNVRYIQERGQNAFATFNENLNTLGEGIYQGGKAFLGEFAKPGNDRQLDDALSAFWSGYKSAMDKAAEENYSARIEAETEEKFRNSAANPAVKTIADAVSSVNTMLPSMAVSAAAGPVGAGVMLGAQTMPGAYIQARNDGATQDQAMAYSALEAVNAGAGEFLIGGLLGKGTGLLGKGANAITKGAVGRFVGNLSNSLAKSPIGKTLISAGAKSLGEGAEEVAQGLISTLNERMTYNPEAKIDAGELAHEGLLGSLMGGAFQAINLPAQYQAYRSDYDTVNGFSLAADAVRSAEDVDVLKKIGGSIIEQADSILSDKKADNDVIQRTSYVKQGVQKTLDLLDSNSEKIIGGNVKKADALETVISSAPENAVDNLISYVNAVSDGTDANTAVKKAVDFVRGEIQNARNLLAETENSSVRTRLTENLINYQEVESTLRNKRKEIVSLLDKKKAAPAESAADTNVSDKSETVESASEAAVELVMPKEEVSAKAKAETAEVPETVPAKEEAEPVRGAADYDDLSTALGVELTGNAEEDARVLLDSYRGARRAAKAVLASATAEGVSDNVRAYGKTLDSEIRRLNKSHAQKAANAARIALKKYGVENVVVDENAGDIGVNGYYDRETNTIHISPYVSEDGAVGRVILHEFTHRGAQADYSLVDAILGAREKLAASGWFEKNHKDLYSREVYEKAYADKVAGKSEAEAKAEIDEEIAAHFMEQIMEDENILEALAREDRTMLQRILDTIRDFFDKGGRENRMAERAVQKIEAVLNKSAAAKSEGVKIHAEGGIITNKNGDAVASDNGNGNLRLSLETYRSGGRDALIDYLENKSDVDMADRVDIVKTLDEVFKICESMTDEYAPFGEWSYAKVDVDENGNPVLSVIKPNGEYVMNLDFSLVCKKRRTLDAVFNEMIRRGVISNFELGQDRIVKINDIIREHGFEVACAICFVDAKRFRQAKVADDFVKMYNSLVKSMAKNGEEIAYFNFGGDTTLPAIEGGIDTRSDSELDTSRLEKIIANAKNKTVQVKIAQHLLDHPADRKLLSRGDFMSSEGFEAVKRLNPDVLSLYNSKKGSGGPKAAFGDVQYMSDIIKSSKFNAEKAYSVGGVRVQSFSDYVARLVFDYVQMIGDMAAKGLPAHAYTKEALFVKQFGLTGMKINMSLVPAVGDGKYAGLNADGSYAWSNETFDYDTAMGIQSDPEYAKNCGTIAVGISDEHIRKLLADDNIRMVIPYHKSGLNPVVAKMNKIDRFSDYTKSQNTRCADGTKLSKEDAAKAPNFNELLHSGMDAVEASKVYVKWCEDNGYLPKFDRFAYNEDGTVSENYYKLLEDFTTMVDGEYHPQGAVKAVFPGEDAAFGSMESLIREGLEEDAVTQGKRDAAVGDIVDEVVALFEGEDVAAKNEKSADNRRESRELNPSNAITIGMSDSERAVILRKKSVKAPAYNGEADSAIANEKDINSSKRDLAKKAIEKIAEEFGAFGEYNIDDVEVHVSFSHNNLRESVFKGADIKQLAKLFPILRDSVENAVGIEKHINRYYYDNATESFSELIGAYTDGDYVIPVRYGLKHMIDGQNVLYVVVDQPGFKLESTKKETGVFEDNSRYKSGALSSRSVSDISISQIFENVNSSDILRYAPDDMLTENQKKIKWEAVAETIRYTNDKNDGKYAEFIAKGNLSAANQMVVAAARAHGYTVKAYHGTPAGGFTKFDPSRIGSNTGVGRGRFSFTSDKSVADSYSGQGNKNARASELVTALNTLFRKHDSDELRMLLVDDTEVPVVWDSDIVIAEGANDGGYIEFDYDWEDNDPEMYASPAEAKAAEKLAEFEGTRRYLIDTLKDYRKGADSSLDEFFDEAIAMLESKSPDRNPETYSVYLKTPTAEFEADPKTYNSVAWDAAYSGDDVVVIHLDNGEDRYFVNNPSSIKSADTIVYDDNGNVIPLSERFKDSNDDIRYSRELEAEEETRDRKLDSLREYVEKRLDKKTADEWEKSTSMTARKKFADDIVNEMPGVTKDAVTEALRDVWGAAEKVKSSKSATAEGVLNELRGKARQAAEKLVDESVVTLVDPRYEEYKELFANLRGTPISVESARSEFDTEEAFEEWKKNLSEMLDISEDGVDVIKVYNEWAEQYPEFLENTPDFNDAIKAGDRLLSLAKHTKVLSEKWKMNPYETVREQAVDTLEMRILAGFVENAEPTQSAKDKAAINLLGGAAKLLEKDVKMLQREVRTLNSQIAILEKRIIGHSESLTLASEQRKYKKNLGRILTALNTPSRKKHIPDNIKGMVVEVLAELDNPKLSAAKRIDSERLNDILTAIKAKDPETITLKNVSGADEDASDVKIDDEVIKRLGQNVEQLNALKLSVESFDRARNSYEGTASEYNAEMRRKVIMLYQQANEVVKALSGYINQSNQVFIDGKIVETQEFVSEMISDLNAKKDVSGDDKMGFTAEVLRGVRAYARSLAYESINPQQFFEMMGASGVRLANSFRAAQNKQQARNLRFVEFMTDLLGKNYDIYEVSGKKPGSRIEITIGESTIDVSRAQLMSLYCLWNRDAGRSHLEAQGAIFLTRRGEEKIERTFAINEEIFDSLMSHLTEKDIEVAKEIQNYLSTDCARYGNEASLQMYGYSMFGETHYFPIRVSSSVKLAHAKEWGAAAGQMNLEFSSFTNSVQPNSTSAIVIDDIFDVSENHAARMSAFSAYAPICHDLQHALKDGRLREAIVRAMGKEGERYLVDFLAAVNGNDSISKKSKEHPRSFAFFEVVGNLSKRAYVSANLSTVTKQYTSITRACAEIDTSYLMKAKRGISSKELYNEMTAHSGVAQIKALGYSDTAFGKSLREQWDNGFVRGGSIINSTEATRTIKRNYDKINDIAMRGTAKADERTWIVLWGACRAEILDKNPGIAYDELMSKTAERFNRLIGVTQVVDSVMDTALFTRRVKGTGFGAFMNEGIRSYGQLLGAIDGVKNGRPGAKKKLAKTVSGILASTVILEPLISALFSTLRDEKDDTDQFFRKVLKNLIGVDLTDDRAIDESIATLESVLTSEMFDGFMSLVPAIGQIYNLINDAWQGYSSSRIGVDELEKVVNTAKALNKASDSSTKTKTKATLEFIGAVSTAVGLPVDRVIRGTTAAIRNAIALTDNHWMQWELNKVFYNLSNGNALSQKNFYDIMKHTKNEGDAESYRKMFADLNTVIRETPSVVGVSNALEKLAKKGAVASEVGSEMWNIEVQSRFYLDDFVSGYKVENFLATVYNNAKRNGADYMKVYLDMPSSDGKFNIEHKPDGKYSYTKETKTEVIEGVPVQKTTYRIDEAGYEQCIHDIGLLSYQVLAELRSPSKSSAWNSLNAKQQVRAIELVYKYAQAKAKTDYDSSYDINGQGKWMTPLYANNAGRAAIASAVLEQAKTYGE